MIRELKGGPILVLCDKCRELIGELRVMCDDFEILCLDCGASGALDN